MHFLLVLVYRLVRLGRGLQPPCGHLGVDLGKTLLVVGLFRLHRGDLSQRMDLRRIQLDGEVLQTLRPLPLANGSTQLFIQGELDGAFLDFPKRPSPVIVLRQALLDSTRSPRRAHLPRCC